MLSFQLLLSLFVTALITALISGLLFLTLVMPMRYIKLHLYILVMPILLAVIGFFSIHSQHVLGPFKIDRLSWLSAGFVMALDFIVQELSIRYLLGDHHCRHYFPLLTAVTSFTSLAWVSKDLGLMALCWGITLLCSTLLMNVNRLWKVPRESAKLSSVTFLCGWFVFAETIVTIYIATGGWRVPQHIIRPTWSLLVNVLLVLVVMIPAAQFPFHRWLIESVTAPTSVSTIMHAGIVNVGGVILTRFAPILDNGFALSLLLILSSISVSLGSGISSIQVDYRCQLVGSTINQMGFVLVQCTLGVYSAAIIHLILHGIFKTTLFLQSGSIVRRFNIPEQASAKDAYGWIVMGRVLAIIVAFLFWMNGDRSAYEVLSAPILGRSLLVSWNQMVASSKGCMARLVGAILITIVTFIYVITHNYFYAVLQNITTHATTPPTVNVVISVVILVFGSLLSIWVARHRHSKVFAVLYVWLANLGEARSKAVESHPNYLKKYL